MAIYGYHRTSTTDQHLERGTTAIQEYCDGNNMILDVLFTDQQTGKNFNRPDYLAMRRVAKSGDIVLLSELDRLGRNKADTLKELQHYKDKGVRVMILEIPTTLIDYGKLSEQKNDLAVMLMETVNNMLIEMYATFAQAEIQKKEKRQREGIQAKKDRGEWGDYGRPNAVSWSVFVKAYEKVDAGTMRPFECMKELEMTKPTFYRYVKRYKAEVCNNDNRTN